MSIDDRRYSEEDVARILRRATEGDPSKAVTRSDGMSLAELKSIGAEVGIDPVRIEESAHALERQPAAKANPLVGTPTAFDHEVRVPGVIPEDRTADVLAVIRRITGKRGDISQVQGALEWRTSGDVGERWVTISVRDGHTTVRASARLGQGAAISLIPTALATAASVVPVLNAPSADGNMMALVLVPSVMALYGATRALWSRSGRNEDRTLARLVAEVGALAEPVDHAAAPPDPEDAGPTERDG